jgi:hypothetical protein
MYADLIAESLHGLRVATWEVYSKGRSVHHGEWEIAKRGQPLEIVHDSRKVLQRSCKVD